MGKGCEVALLVRNDFLSLARGDIGSEDAQSLWIEQRKYMGKQTLMEVIYRPPNINQDIGYNYIRR